MKKTLRSILSLLLTLLILSPGERCAFAWSTAANELPESLRGMAVTAPAQTVTDTSEMETGSNKGLRLLDSAEQDAWIQRLIREWDLDWSTDIKVCVGFWYSETGESWYYNGDEWLYAESLSKVPVSMLAAEKVAAGEWTPDSLVNGITLDFAESTALINSNQESGLAMVIAMGGSPDNYCSERTIQYTDLPESYFPSIFYSSNFYSPRYMTEVLKTLYEGGEERFPKVLTYMKAAQPGEYFNRSASIRGNYEVAQKFGAWEGADGAPGVYHNAGIIFTPSPIVVTVMLQNVDDFANVIAEIGLHFVNVSLELDRKLGKSAPVGAAEKLQEGPAVSIGPKIPQSLLGTTGEPDHDESGSIASEQAAGSGQTESATESVNGRMNLSFAQTEPAAEKPRLPIFLAVLVLFVFGAIAVTAVVSNKKARMQEELSVEDVFLRRRGRDRNHEKHGK